MAVSTLPNICNSANTFESHGTFLGLPVLYPPYAVMVPVKRISLELAPTLTTKLPLGTTQFWRRVSQ